MGAAEDQSTVRKTAGSTVVELIAADAVACRPVYEPVRNGIVFSKAVLRTHPYISMSVFFN